MSSKQVLVFQECSEVVEDPRVQRRCDHPLYSILFLAVAAVIFNADGPVDIEDFGKEKKSWLEKFTKLPHGIPSHNTIGRILSLLNFNRR